LRLHLRVNVVVESEAASVQNSVKKSLNRDSVVEKARCQQQVEIQQMQQLDRSTD
jgi:hypothetical protein